MKTKKSLSIIVAANILLIFVINYNINAKMSSFFQNNKEYDDLRLTQIKQQFNKNTETSAVYFANEGLITEGDSELKIIRSLEDQYYKQKNYEDAYSPWKWLFLNAPKASKNIYIHGVKIIKYFIKNEKDSDRKNMYVDTLMIIYDQRIEYYGQKGFVLGQKGLDLCQYRPNESYEPAYKFLLESLELQGDKSKSSVAYCFIYSSVKMLQNKKITEEVLLDNFIKSVTIVENNIAKGGTKVEKWKKTNDKLMNIMIPYLKCDVLIPFYKKSFKEYPEDLDKIKKMQSVLEQQKCTDSEIYFNICEKIIELEPSAKASASLAVGYYSKGNYGKSIVYYKKAIELGEDDLEKSKLYLSLADIYKRINNYPHARSSAQSAAKLNPNDGTPYILIGDLYAASYGSCGSNSFQKKSVYWAAVDQYSKAQSKGISGASQRITKYKEHFPSKEDAFYQDPPVHEGEDYSIGCWINVTIKARFID